MAETAKGASAPADAFRLVLVLWGSLAAVAELFRHGLSAATQDTPIHLYRLLDFSNLFEAGQIFPRLAPSLGLGYGYATFTFYPPVAVYVGEAFHLLGLGYIASLKATFAAGLLLGGLGIYLLGRDLYGPWGATIAGIAYTYVPYRLLTVYVRGDVAECLAQGMVPLTGWAALRVCDRPSPGRIAFGGLAVAALLLSHALTTLIAVPFLVGIVVIRLAQAPARESADGVREPPPSIRRPTTRWTLAAVGLTVLLGAATSAMYWLPVLLGLRGLNSAALVEGFFDYHRSFMPFGQIIQPEWLYDYQQMYEQGVQFNLGRVQALLIALSAIWIALGRPRARSILLYCLGLTVVLLWMQQDGAAVVWERVWVLRFLQFPHRLEEPIGVIAALLIGSLWSNRAARVEAQPVPPLTLTPSRGERGLDEQRLLTRTLGQGVTIFGRVVAVVSLAGFVYASVLQLPRGHEVLQEAEVNVPTMWRIEVERQRIGGTTQGDYLPETSRGDIFDVGVAPAPPAPVGPLAQLTASEMLPFEIIASTSAQAASTITLDRFAYAGWGATIDGQATPIRPSGPLGLVTLDVPAGAHRLAVAYAGAPGDNLGIALALIGLIGALALVVAPWRRGYLRRAGLVVVPCIVLAALLATRLLPPRQLGASANFGDSIRLVGASLTRLPASAPGPVELNLLWEGLAPIGSGCDVRVRLLDDRGNVVARRDKAPLFGLRACPSWQPGEIVHDLQEIRLPSGAPSGTYHLVVGLTVGGADVAPNGSKAIVAWHDPDEPTGATRSGIDLGTVTVPGGPSEAQLSGGAAIGASLGPSFELVAARVRDSPSTPAVGSTDSRFIARLPPDGRLGVDLLWRAIADSDSDFAVFTQLLDGSANLVAQDDGWPDRFYAPTSTWFPGDTLVDRRKLAPREPLVPGLYRVVVGLYDQRTMARQPADGPGAERDQVVLGTVKVSGADHVFGQRVDLPSRPVALGGQIRILGAGLATDRLHPGDVARVEVGWQALVQPPVDYTVFVHFMSEDGHLVAQHDGPPLGGAFPTTDWDSGDIVYDAIDLPTPVDLSPGRYNVVLGLYRPDTGARLADPSGVNEYLVGAVTVQ